MPSVPKRPVAPSVEIAVAVHALEFARVLAMPTEPLAAYVCKTGYDIGEEVADRIAWTQGGPHPRVLLQGTEGTLLAVGWAPIRAIAEALDPVAPAEAEALRRSPPSDVGTWTVLHASEAVTVARLARNEMHATPHLGFYRETIPPSVYEDENGDYLGKVARIFTEFPGECIADDGAHDIDGPDYLVFWDVGALAVHARTCSKCGLDNVVR